MNPWELKARRINSDAAKIDRIIELLEPIAEDARHNIAKRKSEEKSAKLVRQMIRDGEL